MWNRRSVFVDVRSYAFTTASALEVGVSEKLKEESQKQHPLTRNEDEPRP